MNVFSVGKARFKPSIIGTIFTVLLMACLMSLGFWQLHRAEEKKELLRLAKLQALLSPVKWRADRALPPLFQRLILQGHFLPYTLLLDNQHSSQHQWGYHVINPFEVATGQIVLIDRGFVAGDLQRSVLPSIAIPPGTLSLAGQAYYPSLKGVVLGEVVEPHGARLAVIERVDTKLISNLLHKTVYPFIIRLDKTAPLGYVRDWPIVSMSPQRHYAYALQWFVMALVLLVIYIGLSLKKAEKDAEI